MNDKRKRGAEHPKATHSQEVVESVVRLHEIGKTPKWISETFNLNINTVKDWIYRGVRAYA